MSRRRAGRALLASLPYLVMVAVPLGVWALLAGPVGVDPLLLPSPRAVLAALGEVLPQSETLDAVAVTTREILLAFLIAAVGGVLGGVVIGSFPLLREAYAPILSYAYAIPLIVFYPTFILALGLGSASKIAFGACSALLPIAIATVAGTASTNRTLLLAARSMGARRFGEVRSVVLPSALGEIVTGLQLGLVLAILAVIGAEFIGGTAGLGYLLATAGQALKTDEVFAYVIVTLVLALALNGCMAVLTHIATRRFAS